MKPTPVNAAPKRIILTGGHAATTAVATVEEILRRKVPWELFWIGAKSALEGQDMETLDVEIFPKLGVTFHPLTFGRLQRRFSLYTIPALLKIPGGFVQALRILVKVKPKLVVSFGGYVSFPVVFWAKLLGVPVVIHEQTAAAGRSNRWAAPLATKITLARRKSRKFFPAPKTVVTGNPVMTQICEIMPKSALGSPPTLFVTGGSRGSQTINVLIFQALPKILKDYYLIHQTGHLDFGKAAQIKSRLPVNLAERYEIYARIDPLQIDGVYKRADMVVARAGANTVSEIMVAKIPTVLIPIPWSYLDEQNANAKIAQEFGIAKILSQESASASRLLALLAQIKATWPQVVARVKDKKVADIGAAGRLVDTLEATLL